MVLEISRREVLNNLIRFKESLIRMQKGISPKEERVYWALLNRKTGDMRFAQKIDSLEHTIGLGGGKKESPGDWKDVKVIVHQQAPRKQVHFQVRDAKDRLLKPSDIEPLAWRIASETLEVLNLKSKEIIGQYTEKLPEEEILSELASLPVSHFQERIEDLPGWMSSLSRLEAEEILEKKLPGTYLFREGDELTLSISFHFAEENLLQIRPYLMTVVESDGKVSDILILRTGRGWTCYQDDPNLNDSSLYKYFSSPRDLLQHLNQIAKYPLS